MITITVDMQEGDCSRRSKVKDSRVSRMSALLIRNGSMENEIFAENICHRIHLIITVI